MAPCGVVASDAPDEALGKVREATGKLLAEAQQGTAGPDPGQVAEALAFTVGLREADSELAGADLTGKIGNIKPNWVIPGTVVPDRPVIASIGFVSSANASRWLSPRRGKRPRTHRHYYYL